MKTVLLLLLVGAAYCDLECRNGMCTATFQYPCRLCIYTGLTNLTDLNISFQRIEATFLNCTVPVLDSHAFTEYTQKNLQLLTLRSSCVRDVEVSAFQNYLSLRSLDLADNEIASLHNGMFANLNLLVTLSLENNSITTIELDVFKNLTKLRTLNLSGNRIDSLQAGLFDGLTSLNALNLERNNIKYINCELPADLSLLRLMNNSLSYLNDSGLQNLRRVEQVNLRQNKITSLQKTIFYNLTLVDTIFLSENKLDELNLDFSRNTVLRKFYANHNNIKLIDATVFNSSNQWWDVDLSYNNIESINSNYFKNIRNVMNISYNSIKVLNPATFNSPLKAIELDLQGNLIENVPSGFFVYQRNLRRLDLSKNRISSLTVGSFIGLASLNYLNLNDNKLSILDEVMFHNIPQLSTLDISNNYLKNLNVNELVISTRLTRIALHGNGIRCNDLAHIVRQLKIAKIFIDYGPDSGEGLHGIGCEDAVDATTNTPHKDLNNKELSRVNEELIQKQPSYTGILSFILLFLICQTVLLTFNFCSRYNCFVPNIRRRIVRQGNYEEDNLV